MLFGSGGEVRKRGKRARAQKPHTTGEIKGGGEIDNGEGEQAGGLMNNKRGSQLKKGVGDIIYRREEERKNYTQKGRRNYIQKGRRREENWTQKGRKDYIQERPERNKDKGEKYTDGRGRINYTKEREK